MLEEDMEIVGAERLREGEISRLREDACVAC